MNKKFIIIICILSLLPLAILIFYFFHFNKVSNKTQDWEVFGSLLSGLFGTLLGFISVVLLYKTLQSQKDLSTLQHFESSFFSLLNVQRQILNSLKDPTIIPIQNHGSLPNNGSEYIDDIAKDLSQELDGFSNPKNYSDDKEEMEDIINKVFKPFFISNASQLSHYFRHLYNICNYIHESKIDNKRKYFNILQAQLSDGELYVLFYNCISVYGTTNFLPLADKYGLFENIISRNIYFDKHKKMFYPKTKFKDDFDDIPLSELDFE